jgi:hypothetical protein
MVTNPQTVQPEQKSLASNYRVALKATTADKEVGELSILSCSPSVSIKGPLSTSEMPTTLDFSGTLEEREGGTLLLSYTLGFQAPKPISTGGPPGTVHNIAYENQGATGSLILKVGTAYEVLRMAGVTYTITISQEVEK